VDLIDNDVPDDDAGAAVAIAAGFAGLYSASDATVCVAEFGFVNRFKSILL
jgi:hypothetical protein